MLGDKIKYLREHDGLSRQELAEILGIHRNSILNWENNHSIPSFEKIKELADYFSVSISYLLSEDNDGHKDDKEKLIQALKEYGLDKENLSKALDIIEILKKDTH